MEIITGCFISRGSAVAAAENLRSQGFKGEIYVLGRHNEEDFRESENERSNTDNITGITNYGVLGLAGVTTGFNTFMLPGSSSGVAVGPVSGLLGGAFDGELDGILNRSGVPKKEGEEIKRVIESGNTAILIECEEKEKMFVRDSLQHNGAQNIHS